MAISIDSFTIGKLYEFDGSDFAQIGKVWDINESSNSLIYNAEEILITGWVVNDSNGGEGETSQTKSWDVSNYDNVEIIFNGRAYDSAAWPDWLCHNRIIVNGTTYTCNGSTITKVIDISSTDTLTVQVISSAWGGGLANAYPVTVTSIRVY